MARPKSRVSNVRLTGPLAPFADAYTAKLREQAHTPLTIVNQLRQVARLSCWLEASGLAAAELTGERVDEFLGFQRAGGHDRGSWSRPGLVCSLDVSGELGCWQPKRRRGRARRRRWCWLPSSATCSASGACRQAPSAAM